MHARTVVHAPSISSISSKVGARLALPCPAGPHLTELNEAFRALHEARGIACICFLEGQPTQLAGVFPKLLIVPPESGYCGFGAGRLLPDDDHITVCKPRSREALAYAMLRELVADVLSQQQQQQQQ